MSRPTPKKSSLAGRSPAQPTQNPPQEPAGAPAVAAQTAPAPTATGKAGRKQASFYATPEEMARIRGALVSTQHLEGSRSLSDLVLAAVLTEVQRLEDTYNGGEQFPPVQSGVIPTGVTIR